MKRIMELHRIRFRIDREPLVLLYFDRSSKEDTDNSLDTAVRLLKNFPGLSSYYIDLEDVPSAAGDYLVYTYPTILVYFQGRIKIRQEGSINFKSLAGDLMLFHKQLRRRT